MINFFFLLFGSSLTMSEKELEPQNISSLSSIEKEELLKNTGFPTDFFTDVFYNDIDIAKSFIRRRNKESMVFIALRYTLSDVRAADQFRFHSLLALKFKLEPFFVQHTYRFISEEFGYLFFRNKEKFERYDDKMRSFSMSKMKNNLLQSIKIYEKLKKEKAVVVTNWPSLFEVSPLKNIQFSPLDLAYISQINKDCYIAVNSFSWIMGIKPPKENIITNHYKERYVESIADKILHLYSLNNLLVNQVQMAKPHGVSEELNIQLNLFIEKIDLLNSKMALQRNEFYSLDELSDFVGSSGQEGSLADKIRPKSEETNLTLPQESSRSRTKSNVSETKNSCNNTPEILNRESSNTKNEKPKETQRETSGSREERLKQNKIETSSKVHESVKKTKKSTSRSKKDSKK